MASEPAKEQRPAPDEPPDQPASGEAAYRFADRVRSPEDARRLADHERRIYLPLVLSAILPIVVAASRAATDSRVSIAVSVVSWLVFVYDLFVHIRLVRGYLRMRVGIFDLVVVVITAPWFLIPGFGGTQILMLARLARLVRLFFVSKTARQLGRRLSSVGIFAVAMLLFCAWMAYVAEQPTNPEFATFGDSIWWGIVTLTTVGYGDIVPETEKGRLAGVFLMLTGIATLGVISGTLASAFRSARSPAEDEAAAKGRADSAAAAADVQTELAELKAHLIALEQGVTALVDQGRSSTPDNG
jgi:voltage-gated potassium channel